MLCLVACTAGPRAAAQIPAELAIQLFAGLTIKGGVGTVYSIQYVTDLGQTNESDWRCVAFIRLPAKTYSWFDPTAPATGRRYYRASADVRTNLVFIPPGTFRMGSPAKETDRFANEGPQTAVTITRGYWMGKYEVTQGEYQAVMGSNPSYFIGVRINTDYGTDLNRPVEKVSWYDATNYCGELTQKELAAGSIPANCAYRLPTEAEWEYACRGWNSTRFSYGDDLDYTDLAKYAWFGDNSDGTTHPVGQKLPNLWGLYDMHGNVSEWCHDVYGSYLGGNAIDPRGPANAASSAYVVRDNGWAYPGKYCRSAVRAASFPKDSYFSVGFRVVLAPDQP